MIGRVVGNLNLKVATTFWCIFAVEASPPAVALAPGRPALAINPHVYLVINIMNTIIFVNFFNQAFPLSAPRCPFLVDPSPL